MSTPSRKVVGIREDKNYHDDQEDENEDEEDFNIINIPMQQQT